MISWEIWLVLGLAGAVLIASAAVAGSSPGFWWGVARLAIADLLPLLAKRKSPEEEAIDRDYARRNEKRPTKFNPHPGNK